MLWFRAPEKVYFKRGCQPVALDELGRVMHKKRAFIVTDQFLFKNGFIKPIEQKLDELGIEHACFWDVAPDPTLQCARKGAEILTSFEPDVIIAFGGGSAMDAGKIMWVLYEHPEANFEDMAMDFMDIRKRVYTYPEMGSKAYFVAIPTSSGTGSECTPFSVITDAETGIKCRSPTTRCCPTWPSSTPTTWTRSPRASRAPLALTSLPTPSRPTSRSWPATGATPWRCAR